MAGAALKLFGWDLTKPKTLEKVNTARAETFSPKVDQKERDLRYKGWEKAVKRAMRWNEEAEVDK